MKSRVIFENSFYVVCLTRAGLSVQNKRKGDTGKLLKSDAKDFGEWVKAFDTAIDARESHTLARAFLT